MQMSSQTAILSEFLQLSQCLSSYLLPKGKKSKTTFKGQR